MAALTSLTPGTIFARDFRVVRPLREGGMGAVYVAEQLSTGKRRALKLMSPERVGNPEVRERFVREAKVAANIESDHVVETVTAGVDEASGAPYLVMELLRGEELADAAARTGPIPLDDLKEVFTQIGHALEQAHAQGIVHRDLKPENVFLAASKRRDVAFTAKVLDFGIAKLVADGIQKTGTQPLGSPLFMAPEQTDRKGRVCPATDVWALGLMAFFLLTGKSYWVEADGGSLPGLLREICIDPLVPASQRATELGVAESLPDGFDPWFSRCVVRRRRPLPRGGGGRARLPSPLGARRFSHAEAQAPDGAVRRSTDGRFRARDDRRDRARTRAVPAHPADAPGRGRHDGSRVCALGSGCTSTSPHPVDRGGRSRSDRRARGWGPRLAGPRARPSDRAVDACCELCSSSIRGLRAHAQRRAARRPSSQLGLPQRDGRAPQGHDVHGVTIAARPRRRSSGGPQSHRLGLLPRHDGGDR